MGIKAKAEGKAKESVPGAVIFNGSKFCDMDVSADLIDPCFFTEDRFQEKCVVDLTDQITLIPDMGAIVNCRFFHDYIVNGALVFIEDKAFLTIDSSPRWVGIVDVRTGEVQSFTEAERTHACVCLKWEILAHAGTVFQKTLYEYPAKAAQTTTP